MLLWAAALTTLPLLQPSTVLGSLNGFDVLIKSGILHASDGTTSTSTRATLGEPKDCWSIWTLICSSVSNPQERMFIPSERCLSTGPASSLAPIHVLSRRKAGG